MEEKERWESWLRKSYHSTPTEGPEAKRVKFSDIHQGLTKQFTSREIVRRLWMKYFPQQKSVHRTLARLLVHSEHIYTASDQRSALGDSTDKRSVFVCEHRDLVSICEP